LLNQPPNKIPGYATEPAGCISFLPLELHQRKLNTSFVRKEKYTWNVYRFQGDELLFNANNLRSFNTKVISENRIFNKTRLCSCHTDSLPISYKGKGKALPLQAWCGPEGSRKLRFPGYMATAQDGGKFVSPTHRTPLRGCVDPRVIVRSDGICQRKIPMTPAGIEPATLPCLAKHLNHCDRYSCTLSLTSALDGGGWSTPRHGRFTPGKDPVPILQEAGWASGPVWTSAENLRPPPPPGFDLRTVQPVASRYTDCAQQVMEYINCGLTH
jgi:hypothetical protein